MAGGQIAGLQVNRWTEDPLMMQLMDRNPFDDAMDGPNTLHDAVDGPERHMQGATQSAQHTHRERSTHLHGVHNTPC